MNASHALCAGAVIVAALCVVPTLTPAGDLTPPTGPVSAAMKPLDQVEPRIPIGPDTTPGNATAVYRIVQPGSYYLIGDVAGQSGKHGIEIASANVSINLMGFALRGVPGSLIGVVGNISIDHVRITEGVIHKWGGGGILVNGSSAYISEIRAHDNGDTGIDCGDDALIESCSATGNTGYGIDCGDNAVVRDCVVSGNEGRGLSVDLNASVACVTAYDNGFTGIAGGAGSNIVQCSARSNVGGGMITGAGATVSNCSIRENNSIGLSLSGGCNVSHCSVSNNGSDGIVAAYGCDVSSCSVYANDGDGIEVSAGCFVRHCTCYSNGDTAAGIYVTGSGNRIDGNSVRTNHRGIHVDGAGNIILRNTASANSINFDIAADNRYGPILDDTAAGTPAVSGDSALGTLNSTAPWANFAH